MAEQTAQKLQSATPESVLADLKARGIANLEDLVKSTLQSARTRRQAKPGEEESIFSAFVHGNYVLLYED